MTYGYLPLWVLNNILTLGTISKFYSLMKQNERQTISKIFRRITVALLSLSKVIVAPPPF